MIVNNRREDSLTVRRIGNCTQTPSGFPCFERLPKGGSGD